MMLTKEIKEINKWLRENYGTTVEGLSIFRISWSSDQYEKRRGKFEEFSGPIFLRTFIGVKEVKKYPWIKDRYILEKISLLKETEINDIMLSDSGSNKYSYESIYIFQDKEGNELPVIRQAIEWIMFFYFNNVKSSKNEMEYDDLKEREEIKEKMRQRIGETQQVPHLMDLVA